MGFIIAYETEDTNHEWVICGKAGTLDSAKRSARTRSETSMQNCVIAVFKSAPEWRDHKPYAVYNRHIIARAANIANTCGALVNAVNSDFTINK